MPCESGTSASEEPQDSRPFFPHPPWTVGLVLVFAVVSLAFGTLVNPVFLLIGSPFILVLALWIGVRLVASARAGGGEGE
ncbi:MAG: hypothetical protein ACE5HV_11520 [Acidobacteriota bacterium]